MTLATMQKAFIRKTIIELVARQAIDLKTLPNHVAKKLTPNVALTVEDKKYLTNILYAMLSDGDINITDGIVQTKTRYRLNSVEEDYYLNVSEDTHYHLKTSGNNIVHTVGSERKPYLWARLNPTLTYQVTLIPEPQNHKDPNAIAVCINGQPFAYFPRDKAAEYAPTLNKLFTHDIVITTEATVTEHPDNVNLEAFKINMPETQEIINTLQNA